MVGPTSDTDTDTDLRSRLKLFFIVLVGASAGLITRIGNPTLIESALVTLCGLGVGVLLVWIVFPGNGYENGGTNRRR